MEKRGGKSQALECNLIENNPTAGNFQQLRKFLGIYCKNWPFWVVVSSDAKIHEKDYNAKDYQN